MGLWSKLFGREAKNSTLELFREIYGGRQSSSGATVNVETALETSTVFSICRVLADGVAQVPFRLYQTDGLSRMIATDHPLNMLINRRPNRWQTSFEFRETMMFHLVLTGNFFSYINRVGRNRTIKELIPLMPGDVEVCRLPDMTIEYRVRGPDGSTQTFHQGDIWHVRGPSWNGWRGLDAVKYARNAIGLSMALETAHANLHKYGSQTSGLLSVEGNLGPERYKELAEWLDQYSIGGARYQKPMLLDKAAKWMTMAMTGVDSQHLETRRFQLEELCRGARVMPIMVGHSDKTAAYASSEQMFLAHVVHSLSPWYERIEQSADVFLLTDDELRQGYYTKFTSNGLMRGAADARANFYAKALGSGGTKGWMTQNEVRDSEDMDRSDDPEADKLPQPTAKPQQTTEPPNA
jgi:HK97 family phage portal protein